MFANDSDKWDQENQYTFDSELSKTVPWHKRNLFYSILIYFKNFNFSHKIN